MPSQQMRYKLLGRSGLRVSELALGTMTFGEEWGWGASKEECRRMFDAYAAAGGNFLDTANRYTEGSSEKIVGELVAESALIGLIGGLVGLAGGALVAYLGNELGRESGFLLFLLTPATAVTAVPSPP